MRNLAAKRGRERVARHRAAMRAQGMRLVQIWVPDTRRPGFVEEAKRQSALVDVHNRNSDTLEFLEHVNFIDTTDEEG